MSRSKRNYAPLVYIASTAIFVLFGLLIWWLTGSIQANATVVDLQLPTI